MDISFLFGFRQADTSSFICFINEQGKQENFFIMSEDYLYYSKISIKEGRVRH